MMELKNYRARETLKSGQEVTIRAIRPDDRDALLAAFRGLDERTVYLRFFGAKRDLSSRELTEATDVDFVKTVALVICLPEGKGEKIIGGGATSFQATTRRRRVPRWPSPSQKTIKAEASPA